MVVTIGYILVLGNIEEIELSRVEVQEFFSPIGEVIQYKFSTEYALGDRSKTVEIASKVPLREDVIYRFDSNTLVTGTLWKSWVMVLSQ